MIPDVALDVARRALRQVAARAVDPPPAAGVAVTVHFHPDRLVDGSTVLAGLARSGRYLSQFVTGVSNGGLTAYRGGARWGWESRLFGGVYDAAATGRYDPQQLKRVWHLLARFGAPG